jgi:SAM-dependent methyltransferase
MRAATRHDSWQSGDSYDGYMGRWSRRIAPRFLDWLDPPNGLDWLEIGCGTGALSAEIIAECAPRDLIAIDPSEGFLAKAREAVPDTRADFRIGDAQALAIEGGSRDVVVSGLVLNFVPDRPQALAEMVRVTRPGGTVAFYVWDYPGGGLEFLRAFWRAASALDPAAGDLTEDRRFPFCTADALAALTANAGLAGVRHGLIVVPTIFDSFDDFWRPFTLGTGPAPGYCMSLAAEAREQLRQLLDDTLPRRDDGSIALAARAWAVRGEVP